MKSQAAALQTALNFIADSRDGYLKAAKTVEYHHLKRIFTARASERTVMCAKLKDAIEAQNSMPEQGGSALGTMHRVFLPIADLLSDEEAVLKVLGDGESHLRAKIRDIIENGDLTLADRAMLLKIERELEADAQILSSLEAAAD